MSSKLSFIIAGALDEKLKNQLVRIQPSVVKWFDNPSEQNVGWVKDNCPGALQVYRQGGDFDYHDSADIYFAKLADAVTKLHGRGVVYEGANEPVITKENASSDLTALANWTSRFCDLMHSVGERVAAFSFSTGNPTPDVMQLAGIRLRESAAKADYIALHEYANPNLGDPYCMVGQVRQFLAALGISKPVLITETGIDVCGDKFTSGYRAQLPSPEGQNYIPYLRTIDDCYRAIPEVVGATIFQYQGDWPSFNVESDIAVISDYVVSRQGEPNPPTPPQPPPEPPMPEPIVDWYLDRYEVPAGESVTVTYYCQYIAGAWLDNQPLAPAVGSQSFVVASDHTFRLTVKYPDGTMHEWTKTVKMIEEPQPPEPPEPPSDCYIDPRITDRIKVTQGKEFKCLGVWFMNDTKVPFAKADNSQTESRGNVDSRFMVLDKNNRPLPGVWCVLDWPDGCDPRLSECDGTVVWELYSDGYNIQVGDLRIDGIGLIGKHHVRYQVQVQKVG